MKIVIKQTRQTSAFMNLILGATVFFVMNSSVVASGVQKTDNDGDTLNISANIDKSIQNTENGIKISAMQSGYQRHKKIKLDKESYDLIYQKRDSRDGSFLVKNKLLKDEIKKTHRMKTHQKEKIYISSNESQTVRIKSTINEWYNLNNKIVEEANVQSKIEKYDNERKVWEKAEKGTISNVDVSEDGEYVFSKREENLEVFHEIYDRGGNIIFEKKGSKVRINPVKDKKSILAYEPLDDKTIVTFLSLDLKTKNEKVFPRKFVMEEKINNNSDFIVTDVTKNMSYLYGKDMQRKCEFNSRDNEVIYLNDTNYVLLTKDGTTLKEAKIYGISSCNLEKNLLIPSLMIGGDTILPKRIDVSDNLKFFIVGSMAKVKGGEVYAWIFDQNGEILWNDKIKIDTPWFPRANPNFINNNTQIRIIMEGTDVERVYNVEGVLSADNK